jgi:hypothetical protein
MPEYKKSNVTQKATTFGEKKKTYTKKVTNSEPVVNESYDDLNDLNELNDDGTDKKKSVRKASRTLVVSGTNGSPVSESIFSDLNGLEEISEPTKTGSRFLTFQTIPDSLTSFRKLRQDHPELKVLFARYEVFFTISGLTKEDDYSKVKEQHMAFVEKEADANVLYYKLYRKGDDYLNCGDLTVDTKKAMDKLISKESPLKNFTISNLSVTNYRFNRNQKKPNNNNQDASA